MTKAEKKHISQDQGRKKHNNQLFCHRVDFFQGNRHSVQIIIYIVLFFICFFSDVKNGDLLWDLWKFVRMQMKRKRMQELQSCPLSLFIEGSG